MNLKLLFTMCLFSVFFSTIKAQSNPQREVIKQCIAFKELQEGIPNEVNQNMTEVLILNENLNFLIGSDLSINNKPARLISGQDLKTRKSNGYFVFLTLDIKENDAIADYNFIYQKNNEDISISVRLILKNATNKWEVVNSTIQK
jgi:hypothetical protein